MNTTRHTSRAHEHHKSRCPSRVPVQTDPVCPQHIQQSPAALGAGLSPSVRTEATVNLDALVTAREFEVFSKGRATLGTVSSWRRDGKVEPIATRVKGRSPLYRLGDLVQVERDGRIASAKRGGIVRKPRPTRASAA